MSDIVSDSRLRYLLEFFFLLAAFVIVVFTILNVNLRNKQSNTHKNVLSQGLFSALYTVFFGLIFVGYSSLSLSRFELGLQYISLWRACVGAALGFAFSIPAMMCLRPEYNITWDENKLEGPSKLGGPYVHIFRFLKKERQVILWEDVVAHGHAVSGYFFVASHDGFKIYFRPYSNGFDAFEEKLRKHISQG